MVRDIVGVGRHRLGRARHGGGELLDKDAAFGGSLAIIEQRIEPVGQVKLADMDREPARASEQVHVAAQQFSVAAEMVDLPRQRVGNVHRRAIAPQRRVVALGEFVVKDDEVADPFDFGDRDAIIFIANGGVEIECREESEQL